MSKTSPLGEVIAGVVPTFGHAASVISARDQVDELSRWRHTGILAPLAWAFIRREGSPDVRYATRDDVSVLNVQLNRGTELVHRSAVDATQAINTAFEMLSSAMKSVPDWLAIGELDIVSKLSILRRHNPMWFLPSPPPPLIPPTSMYVKVAAALAEFYYSRYKKSALANLSPYELALLDTDPPDTNAGWPLFSSNIGDFLVLASATDFKGRASGSSWPKPQEWMTAIEQLGLTLGVQGDMFTMGVARRAGPTRKQIPLYDMSSGHPLIESLTAGCYTRSRIVYMAPRLLNIAISPLSMQVKTARLSHWGFAHDAASRIIQMSTFAEAHNQGKRIIESDFSGFDTTYTPEHRAVIYDSLERVGFHADSIALLRALDANGSFITPSWSGPQGGEGERVSGRLGLFSGIKETTNLGSFHAQVIALKAFIQAKALSLDDVAAGRLPPFLNLGDDVLIAAPPALTPQLYEHAAAEEGVKAKLLDGRRMLMKHISPEGEYSVAARIIQQTLANEDSYLHLGHVLLGLAARLSVLPHPSLVPVVKEILMTTITGEAAEPIRVSGCDPRVLMQHPSIPIFLASASGKSWLDSLANMETRPVVTELLRAAAALGADASLKDAVITRKTIINTLLHDPLPSASDALGVLGERLSYAE